MAGKLKPKHRLVRTYACTLVIFLSFVCAAYPSFAQRNNLTFSSDFEGSTPLSIWPTVVGRTTQSSDYSREGNYSARVEVVRGDDMIANGARSEMNLNPIPSVPAEQWFGMSFYIPSGWTADADGMTDILAQWHSVGGAPPVAFGINVNSWYVQFRNTSIIPLGNVTTGTWTDVVFHMIWSTGSSGLTEVWINGAKVETFNGANFPDEGDGPFFKCGCYKWPWNTGDGERDGVGSITYDRLLYVDAVRVGNGSATYNDVAPGNGPTTPSAPVINLNSTQNITLPINSVTLNATVTDLSSVVSANVWTQVSGPNTATINSPSALSTTASGLIAGTYVFNLSVTDLLSAVASATVTVTVNAATQSGATPSANAGPNQSLSLPISAATLDGSASKVDGGTITNYLWTKTNGPDQATITSNTSATTTVTGLIQGEYTFQLLVTSDGGITAMDTIHISVIPQVVNVAPVANAGSGQSITLPLDSAVLDATASVANGSNIASYNWTQLSGPSAGTLAQPNDATTEISGLVTGSYTYKVTVIASNGLSDDDTVIVKVYATNNISPTANAGSNQTITLPVDTVVLDGSRSVSPSGTITGYLWSQISGPSVATIEYAQSAITTITSLDSGTYYFRLGIRDSNNDTAIAVTRITVRPPVPVQADSALQAVDDAVVKHPVLSQRLAIDAQAWAPTPLTVVESVTVYPNPANSVVNLKLTSPATGKMSIVVFDMSGKALMNFSSDKSIATFERQFNVSSLPAGVYIIQTNIGHDKPIVAQFVKQ